MSTSNFYRLTSIAARRHLAYNRCFTVPDCLHGNHHPRPAVTGPAAGLAHLFAPEETGGAPEIAAVAPLERGDRVSRAAAVPGDDDQIRRPAPVQPGRGCAGRRLAGCAGLEADALRASRKRFLFYPAPLPGPGHHDAVHRPLAVPWHGNLPEHAPRRARAAATVRPEPADHGRLRPGDRLLRRVCVGLAALAPAQQTLGSCRLRASPSR